MSERFEYWLSSPDSPLDAAREFFERSVPNLREALSNDGPLQRPAEIRSIVITFGDANPAHRGWRLAAVQDLARELAPVRINAIFGDNDAGLERATEYLHEAPGVTGQLLAVDGNPGESG